MKNLFTHHFYNLFAVFAVVYMMVCTMSHTAARCSALHDDAILPSSTSMILPTLAFSNTRQKQKDERGFAQVMVACFS
jgi:hypothetical protein